MKLVGEPRQLSDGAEVPTCIERLPLEVQRSLSAFLHAAPTGELHRRRAALVRGRVTHLAENEAAPTT